MSEPEPEPVRVILHEDTVYVDVKEFVDVIIRDLQNAPEDAFMSRNQIIFAMQQYAREALEAS